jgi:hypothetical protein
MPIAVENNSFSYSIRERNELVRRLTLALCYAVTCRFSRTV